MRYLYGAEFLAANQDSTTGRLFRMIITVLSGVFKHLSSRVWRQYKLQLAASERNPPIRANLTL